MIKVTFEASSTAALYKAIAEFLEPATAPAAKKTESKKTSSKSTTSSKSKAAKPADVAAAPAAIALAKEKGVDLKDVPASGKGGKVLKSDVEAHLAQSKPKAAESEKKSAEPADETSAEHTLDDAREALKKFGAEKGIPACMELLQRYGVQKVGLLLPTQIDKFIAEINKELS